MAKAKKTNSDVPKKKSGNKKKSTTPIEPTFDFQEKDNTTMTLAEEELPTIVQNRPTSKSEAIDEKIIDTTNVGNLSYSSQQSSGRQFNVDEPVYLQIHVGNIYSIFGNALILPSKYVKNRAFHDPQTLEEDYLLLTNSFISAEDENTALLELNLLNDESKELIISDGVAFMEKPISISRIKRIHVKSEKVKKEVISTALVNDGGIIPEALIVAHFPINNVRVLLGKPERSKELVDYSDKIARYNRILGALTYLRNYSLLVSEKAGIASTLPEHFFFALQSLNAAHPLQLVRSEKTVIFYSQLFGLQAGIENMPIKWLFDRVNINKNFNDEDIKDFGSVFLNSMSSKESFNSAKEILNSLRLSLERKRVLKDILQLPGTDKFALYLFAFLRIYGNASTEEKSIARLDIPDYVSLMYGEFVFGILGYFYGYATLRNFDEKLNIRDSVFQEILTTTKRLAIKFELTTMLDYIVLESVYSNVFIKPSPYIKSDFLESDSIKQEWVKRQAKLPGNYDYKVDDIFGKQVYRISRKPVLNELDVLLDKLPLEIPVISDLGVFCFFNKLPYHFINLGDLFRENRLRYFMYFKKEDIKEAAIKRKLSVVELQNRIEASFVAKQL